ncbi:MAG: YraN family protein, partial [Thermodesulfovibrionales bacterium]
LKEKGFKIIMRNFKTPLGEIDIIAEDRETLVFIEVKTRSDDSFGFPFEAVDGRKRERMRRIALLYLKNLGKERPARFDVISVEMKDGCSKIDHIVEAF